ncbi:MAG: cyclodeaminase/cyclohydrolase family protein [Planctomycetota bacterium]|jgi:formiminotetrahydrofolate cyclodeaminase|nr:cyclodeaminase/cyclohydrolase family protein [Planctomycetota bacterium]
MDELASLSLREFLERAASGEPVPGGGSVAALAGALGAAMAAMAANFTVGKPKFAAHDGLMRRTLAELAPCLDSLREGVDADARAFSELSLARRPPGDGEAAAAARREAVRAALLAALRAPARTLAACRRTAELLPDLAGAANPNLLSDVEVAAIMIPAAARAALVNVLANSRRLDGAEARQAEAGAGENLARTEKLAAEALAIVNRRRS